VVVAVVEECSRRRLRDTKPAPAASAVTRRGWGAAAAEGITGYTAARSTLERLAPRRCVGVAAGTLPLGEALSRRGAGDGLSLSVISPSVPLDLPSAVVAIERAVIVHE